MVCWLKCVCVRSIPFLHRLHIMRMHQIGNMKCILSIIFFSLPLISGMEDVILLGVRSQRCTFERDELMCRMQDETLGNTWNVVEYSTQLQLQYMQALVNVIIAHEYMFAPFFILTRNWRWICSFGSKFLLFLLASQSTWFSKIN